MKTTAAKFTVLVLLAAAMLGCFPEDISEGNGLTETSLNANFTITPKPGSPNRFILRAESTTHMMSRWDLGDGAPPFTGRMEQEIFLPDAGNYTITHHAIGRGGFTQQASRPVTVEVSDPASGNIVLGGRLDTQTDIGRWTILNISASGTAWAFAGGRATVTGGGWNQQALFQAINVEAGRTYSIDLVASSTSGVRNTWFEVFCSPVEPIQNRDYSAGGVLRNINTWAGCGGSPFAGRISVVGCGGARNRGTFTAAATGLMYLVIKCGGERLNDGISIDNVEVRGQQ